MMKTDYILTTAALMYFVYTSKIQNALPWDKNNAIAEILLILLATMFLDYLIYKLRGNIYKY